MTFLRKFKRMIIDNMTKTLYIYIYINFGFHNP